MLMAPLVLIHIVLQKMLVMSCMCTEISKYAPVYVCICVRQSGILIQSVLATLLVSGSLHLESHYEIQMGASVLC